ncbi:hypothetical protein KSP35_06395 [Aquihabitans sp. G128]|uniref:carbamoyltransferase family protein n=1 Tax=Aquihabitans sp. G128 TaxID=2849779 RepID=UPI001C22BFB3|nr:carbamoyltransferase N-terminal domain-containing protein [Aquihabitans sp. G128]QXC62427.1 hypothetical protein KSP35_06395 [Aquihabitans sp. G128]
MDGERSGQGVVLGVSADFHDAAAALVVDGVVVAAAEEERFTRRKHDPSLPRHAIAWCLEHAGVGPGDLDRVAFYEKPLSAYDRVLTTHAGVGPRGFPQLARAVRSWSGRKLWVGYRLEKLLQGLGHTGLRTHFSEHHQSHAASAFYPSPFDRAAILVLDGVGEWATSSVGWGAGHRIELHEEVRFPDSLGLLYSAFTAYCGFEVNDGEYKLMGLAPFGTPRYEADLREHVVHVADDGSLRLDQRWFDYRAGARMVRPRLAELLGPPRDPDEPLDERHADIAASIQAVLEEAIVRMGRHARALTGERNLCLAGGVALNCVANERLVERAGFDDLWVQPAAGDGGGALGAALWTWHQVLDHPRPERHGIDGMSGALLGPAYDDAQVQAWLEANGVAHTDHGDHASLCREVAARIDGGALVGWFQGAMEFGPRALGHRSILGDARDAANVGRINASVKRREGFRPFAPAVLAEERHRWFAGSGDRAYMTVTAPVHPDQRVAAVGPAPGAPFAERLGAVRSTIPACTHVDGSARLQTVDAERNPAFHALLQAFHDRTGCPVLINTSFNRAGEPLVRTPADAVRCFEDTELDLLVLGRFTVEPAAVRN